MPSLTFRNIYNNYQTYIYYANKSSGNNRGV